MEKYFNGHQLNAIRKRLIKQKPLADAEIIFEKIITELIKDDFKNCMDENFYKSILDKSCDFYQDKFPYSMTIKIDDIFSVQVQKAPMEDFFTAALLYNFHQLKFIFYFNADKIIRNNTQKYNELKR